MPLLIVRNDITKMDVDAIVNAANPTLLGGGGVDGAIHSAAGPQLLEECRTLGGCMTGQAKLTGGYRLPARHVIHTVGPIWQGGAHGERVLLTSCYRESLQIAADNGFTSIAFPLISSGIYGYPKEEAFEVAEETCRAFLEAHEEMTVYITVFGHAAFVIGQARFNDIRSYIDDRYVEAQERRDRRRGAMNHSILMRGSLSLQESAPAAAAAFHPQSEEACFESAIPPELDRALQNMEESFTQMLLRKIDERGITDAQCYKRANMDRKHFSKIRSNLHYHPKKRTALGLAVALELPIDELGELLRKAGYALSRSDRGDIIVEYYVINGVYDIHKINEALFAFDQPLIGG